MIIERISDLRFSPGDMIRVDTPGWKEAGGCVTILVLSPGVFLVAETGVIRVGDEYEKTLMTFFGKFCYTMEIL